MSDNKTQDFFSEKNAAVTKRNPYFKLENIGDAVRGILVKRSVSENTQAGKEETYQRVYTLCVTKEDDGKWTAFAKGEPEKIKAGELIDVYGKMLIEKDGQKIAICNGVEPEEVELGYLTGFKYTEQLAPKQKGFSGVKVMRAFVDKNVQNLELVKEHGGEMASFGEDDKSVAPF